MLRQVKMIAFPMIISLGLGFTSCSKDEQKPEEVVSPEKADSPGALDDASASSLNSKAVFFAFDDYTLSMDAQSTLNALGDQLKANKSAVAQIEGHCDERGSIEYNLALGDKRAQSVKNYLVQLGVETARITTVSYGEEKPAAEGHDESTWSKNRRAEFVVSSK
jgi:peptidoglycan-associated lipoprotein